MWEVAIRVPSIGLTLEERRIVREGYELAERLLRNYEAPATSLGAVYAKAITDTRDAIVSFCRGLARY